MEFYDGKKVGEITSRLNRDINQAQNISTEDLSAIFRHLFETIASMVVLYQMSPSLCTIILAVTIPKFIIIKRRAVYIKDQSKNLNDARAKLNS
jgi:ABC-type multidrug transport system fused ATPase/permease subunit